MSVVKHLLHLIQVESLEANLFRGESADIGGKSVFGGQVLGQALMAALRTVGTDRAVHSLHAYFLRPGDMQAPIVYDVDRIRDGSSFTTRRIVAIQHGRPIFNMSASFQVMESGAEHQDPMPDVPRPEALRPDAEVYASQLERLPERARRVFSEPRPFEFRQVQPIDLVEPSPRPATHAVWLKLRESIPEDPCLHQALLAYVSDFSLLQAALLPHGYTFTQPHLQIASLDHAMWFHRPFRLDEWMLYATESPSASNSRGLCRGRFYRADGTLVATTVQEGLVRDRSLAE